MAAMRADQIPLLEGQPGIGKSALVYAVAREMGAHVITFRLGEQPPEEMHGLPIISPDPIEINGKAYRAVVKAPPDWVAAALNHDGWVIVFLDELLHLSDSGQGMALAILHDRIAASIRLDRAKIAIVAAGNPPELSAGGWKRTAPLTRRTVILVVNVDTMEFSSMDAFPSNWGYPLEPIVKFGQELNMQLRLKWRGILAAYVRARPNCFDIKDVAEMSNGFLCPATCETIADLGASVEQFTSKTPASLQGVVRQELFVGAVGLAAASDILAFIDMMDVPSADELLDNPDPYIQGDQAPSFDKLYYLLMSLSRVMEQRTQQSIKTPTKAVSAVTMSSWQAAVKLAVFFQKKGAPKDLLCMFVAKLVSPSVKPKSAVPPPEMLELFTTLDILKVAGLSGAGLTGFEG